MSHDREDDFSAELAAYKAWLVARNRAMMQEHKRQQRLNNSTVPVSIPTPPQNTSLFGTPPGSSSSRNRDISPTRPGKRDSDYSCNANRVKNYGPIKKGPTRPTFPPSKARSPTRPRVHRIPLRPRAIEQPSLEQLVFWSLREGILQRLSPDEANLPPDYISSSTLNRLTSLYGASLERWRQKEAAELAARPPTQPLRQLLAEALASLPLRV